jgi:hypothetical protein
MVIDADEERTNLHKRNHPLHDIADVFFSHLFCALSLSVFASPVRRPGGQLFNNFKGQAKQGACFLSSAACIPGALCHLFF